MVRTAAIEPRLMLILSTGAGGFANAALWFVISVKFFP